MKERPILFSAPMVRALLAGTKTQTRRIVKSEHVEDAAIWADCGDGRWESGIASGAPGSFAHGEFVRCPYGAPGDRLWVRETWFPDPPINGWPGDVSWQDERRIDGVPECYRKPKHCIFAAGWDGITLRWRPSIHMPRWASRITLEVTAIRVERLHAITEEDAKAEGVDCHNHAVGADAPSYRASFSLLWREINGAESWAANPWVWVVGFKKAGGK